jgi:hypothetical protein
MKAISINEQRAEHSHRLARLGRARAEQYGDAAVNKLIADATGVSERLDDQRAELWCVRQLQRIEEMTRGMDKRAAVRLSLEAEYLRDRHAMDVRYLGHTGAEQYGDAETDRIIAEAAGIVLCR